MSKLPFIQWYPADYIAATRHLSHLGRSVWSDLLNFMALEKPRGIYQRQKEALIRQFNIPVDQFDDLIHELRSVAEIEVRHDSVTLISRRMVDDERERILALNRKRKERGVPPVTVPSRLSHREKLEVRSQRLEVRTSKTKETPPIVPQELVPAERHATPEEPRPYKIPLPEEQPADSLVLFYKVLQGAPYDFRPWDKSWGRWKVKAAELLGIFQGDYSSAYQCLKTKGEELTTAQRTWNFNTIVDQAHLWRQQHGGDEHVHINRDRFLRDVIEQRKQRRIEGLRRTATDVSDERGALPEHGVHAPVRDHMALSPGSGQAKNGHRNNGHEPAVGRVPPEALEAPPDRIETSSGERSGGGRSRGEGSDEPGADDAGSVDPIPVGEVDEGVWGGRGGDE